MLQAERALRAGTLSQASSAALKENRIYFKGSIRVNPAKSVMSLDATKKQC